VTAHSRDAFRLIPLFLLIGVLCNIVLARNVHRQIPTSCGLVMLGYFAACGHASAAFLVPLTLAGWAIGFVAPATSLDSVALRLRGALLVGTAAGLGLAAGFPPIMISLFVYTGLPTGGNVASDEAVRGTIYQTAFDAYQATWLPEPLIQSYPVLIAFFLALCYASTGI